MYSAIQSYFSILSEKIMKPFSLISNLERLLKPSETEEFSIINGFKVCAILQVIIGHRWFIELGNPQSNPNFTHWVSAMQRIKH